MSSFLDSFPRIGKRIVVDLSVWENPDAPAQPLSFEKVQCRWRELIHMAAEEGCTDRVFEEAIKLIPELVRILNGTIITSTNSYDDWRAISDILRYWEAYLGFNNIDIEGIERP